MNRLDEISKGVPPMEPEPRRMRLIKVPVYDALAEGGTALGYEWRWVPDDGDRVKWTMPTIPRRA